MKRFAHEVEAAGQSFLFVVFPREDGDIWGEGPRSYGPLLEALPGLDTLDLADALAASVLEPGELRARGGHYSAAANDVVARAILDALPRH